MIVKTLREYQVNFEGFKCAKWTVSCAYGYKKNRILKNIFTVSTKVLINIFKAMGAALSSMEKIETFHKGILYFTMSIS